MTVSTYKDAIGTTFVVKKSVTSSTVLTTGIDLTGVSSGGEIAIEAIIFQTDGTGFATATNIEVRTDNAKGAVLLCAEAVASLGASVTVNMLYSGVTVFHPMVLESGKKVTINATVMNAGGSGVCDVRLICRRLAAGAALAAA